jgi:hypothetical protein
VNTFHRSNSEITYIGPSKPEIVLNTKAEVHNYDMGRVERYFPFAKPGDIRVFIDTSKIIGSPGPALTFPPPPPPSDMKENEFIKNSAKSKNVHLRRGFLSDPVFIENLSTDNLQVGYGFHIPVIFEAQDEEGNWASIQKHHRYASGNGLPTPYLPKNDILIASCPVLYGDFHTKLRLKYGFEKFGFTYSNEFFGNIHRQMFEKVKSPPNLY